MALMFGVALIALAGPLVAAARASYPGSAGEIVYQDSYRAWDPLNNGAVENDYSVRAAALPATGTTAVVTCRGADGGFATGSPEFCPESGASFAPNGAALVFTGAAYAADGSSVPDQSACSGVGYCPEAIIVAAADGTGGRLLSIPIADAEHAAFMPDGRRIVFAGRTGPRGQADLYTVNSDGSALTRVTSDGGTDPSPCPNGSVVYVHRGDLYLLAANLRTRRRLTRHGGTHPDCSHDSRTIALLRRATLYTMSVTGRHLRRLSSPGVADGRPAFSPAGGEIAFTTTRACTSHCGGRYPGCTNLTDRLELIDLLGRRRRSVVTGSNLCSSDGDLGGDTPGDADWQPPAGGQASPSAPARRQRRSHRAVTAARR